jgi:type IV secretory pathway VirB4 component
MNFPFGDQTKIQKAAPDSLFNTETMLPVSEIRDGVVILKDGGLRGIIKVEGLNLDLKNYDEQQVVLEQYKKFLNGLSFPIQILVRNTYLDLTEYLGYVRTNIASIDNPAMKNQGQTYLAFLEGIDSKQGLIYVKEFYVIVPFYADEQDNQQVNKSWREKFMNVLNAKDDVEVIVERYRKFLQGQKQLQTRINLIIEGLAGLNIPSDPLSTSEIVSLLFRMYNPLLDSSQAKFVE